MGISMDWTVVAVGVFYAELRCSNECHPRVGNEGRRLETLEVEHAEAFGYSWRPVVLNLWVVTPFMG